MADISNKLLNMLTEFFICEIGSKAIDGITYCMLLKDAKERDIYERYKLIRKQANEEGNTNDEIFRIYEVNNGYIFDMDLSIAKNISYEITKAVSKANGGETPYGDLIGDMPEKRRKRDIINLAKFLKSEFDSGKEQTEIALFSRNSTNKILVTCKGPNNEVLAVKYNAYALRHWDLENVNEKLLIPAGFRVSRLQPCEVLPYKTGVSFIVNMEQM